MLTEPLQQILEQLKTYNINIDSQTALQIVEELKPLAWFVLITNFLFKLIPILAIIVAIYFIVQFFFFYANKRYLLYALIGAILAIAIWFS